METESPSASRIAPGGLFFLGPGGAIGGAQRQGVIELKSVGSALVVSPLPAAVVETPNGTLPADDCHLTIHQNLMVHLKRERDPGSVITLTSAALSEKGLEAEVVHVVTIGVPPVRAVQDEPGRFQKRYEGGTLIVPLIPDRQYSYVTSHLVVDVWATRPDFSAPGKLPALRDQCRSAFSAEGLAAIALPGSWAFRDVKVPAFLIFFRTWFAESQEFSSRSFFSASPSARLTEGELIAWANQGLDRYEIRGFRTRVVFRVGGYSFFMTPEEARAMAVGVARAEVVNFRGMSLVKLHLGEQELHFPHKEVGNLTKFLFSAADYADGKVAP